MRNAAIVNSAFGFFMFIGLAIMGGSVYFGWQTAKKVQTVDSWPTVPAYIIESRIEWAVEAHDRAGSKRSYSYAYELPVLAGYLVDNEFYTSATPAIKTISDSKIMPRDPWKNPPDSDIVQLFKKVPQGSVIPIHYNPATPKEAYLFSKLPFWQLYTGNIIGFLFGLLSCLFGFVPMLLMGTFHGDNPLESVS